MHAYPLHLGAGVASQVGRSRILYSESTVLCTVYYCVKRPATGGKAPNSRGCTRRGNQPTPNSHVLNFWRSMRMITGSFSWKGVPRGRGAQPESQEAAECPGSILTTIKRSSAGAGLFSPQIVLMGIVGPMIAWVTRRWRADYLITFSKR